MDGKIAVNKKGLFIMEISSWIESLQGKSRWELQYDSTGLILDDCRVLVADVYDDYLIFNLLDVELNARQLFMMEIAAFNECNAITLEMRIEEAINRVTNE